MSQKLIYLQRALGLRILFSGVKCQSYILVTLRLTLIGCLYNHLIFLKTEKKLIH